MTELELQGIGLGRLVLAAVLSAAIGWERERTHRPAGLRTHMTVGMSGAVLMLLADLMVLRYPNELNIDPTRVLEAVVAGVAFLGAGTIVVHKGAQRVGGLTTAASLLATATIGVTTGLGAYILAVGATLFLLVILAAVRRLTVYGDAPKEAAEVDERPAVSMPGAIQGHHATMPPAASPTT